MKPKTKWGKPFNALHESVGLVFPRKVGIVLVIVGIVLRRVISYGSVAGSFVFLSSYKG